MHTVRAPGPVVEMSQLMVRNLRRRGLFRRCLRSLWKYLLGLDLGLGNIFSCLFHTCFANIRAPSDLLTALYCSLSW